MNIGELLVFAALLLAFAGVLAISIRSQIDLKKERSSAETVEPLFDIAPELLSALGDAGIIVEYGNTVAIASESATSLGLVAKRSLVHTELIDLVERVLATGEPEQIQAELVFGRGKENVWVLARAARVGKHVVVLGIDDRTQLQRVEEMRRDFVANVSHELKTPISAIGLLAEAASAASKDPEKVNQFTERMLTETQRLSELVSDIIELSKVQSSDTLQGREIVEVKNFVESAAAQNQIAAQAKSIQVDVKVAEGLQVQGDQGMLTAAIRNLIENAINYSDAGTRIGVGARLNAGFAEISVTDNGVGISQEEQERVFERFYRSDSSRSRATGGTGLGLSIVKHIAQQHRGEVKLFSQPGIGSTFTLRIPALAEPVSVIGLASSKVGSQPGSVAPSESEPNVSKLA